MAEPLHEHILVMAIKASFDVAEILRTLPNREARVRVMLAMIKIFALEAELAGKIQ